MDNTEIENYIDSIPSIKAKFSGIYDERSVTSIKNCKKKPALILYTETSEDTGHWVAMYLDKTSEFYDPLGQAPSKYSQEFENILIKCSEKYSYSTFPTQGPKSIYCGMFVLCYLYLRCNGVSYENILSMYTDNFVTNDKIVKTFLLSVLNKNN